VVGSYILLTGVAKMLANPIMLVEFSRIIRSAGDEDFFGQYLPTALLAVILVGSLMVSTALLTSSLLSVVGSPFFSFVVIAALQSTLTIFSLGWCESEPFRPRLDQE
jgi:hypothetical protein